MFCDKCDMAVLENIHHLITQCSAYEELNLAKLIYWLLCGRIDGLENDTMLHVNLCTISGKAINSIYIDTVRVKKVSDRRMSLVESVLEFGVWKREFVSFMQYSG